MSKQYIVNRHTTPSTPTLDEVPNEKIRVFANEVAIDAALPNLDEDEIVATEDGAESSTRVGNPIGTILALHSNAVPYGYLPCNGVAFDEHQYPALYALLGDNHTPYSYDKSRLGDLENITISTSSASPTVMPYDGFLYITYANIGNTPSQYYLNGIRVIFFEGEYSSASSGVTLAVKKGDSVYVLFNNGTPVAQARFYTHFNIIKATSGLEETQQDYVLQSLLEADNYSTSEVATGAKWIDGKTIYRRTFYSATNWASSTVIGTISNLGMVIQIRDICSDGGAYMQNYGADATGTTQRTTVNISTGAVTVYRGLGFANNLPSIVIIEYTKN